MHSNKKVLVVVLIIVTMMSATTIGLSSSAESGEGTTIDDVSYSSGVLSFRGGSPDADVVRFFVTYPNGTHSEYGFVQVGNGSYSGTMLIDLPDGSYTFTVFSSGSDSVSRSFEVRGLSIASVSYDSERGVLSFAGTSSAASLRFFITYPDGGYSPYGSIQVVDGRFSGTMNISLPEGSYTFTVFQDESLKDTAAFECRETPSGTPGVTLNKNSVAITAESDEVLSAVAHLTGSSTVTWRSLDELIVEVDSNGRLTPRAVGTAEVIATSGSYSDTCVVTVGYAPLTLDKTSMELQVGASGSLSVTVPAGYAISEVIWKAKDSTSSSLVSLNPNGDKAVVTAGTQAGVAKVTVLIGNLYSAECSVSVVPKPISVEKYSFFIQMKYDADKVRHSYYNQSMLESGFTLYAEGTSALDAFEKACAQNNIPFVPIIKGELKGWFDSLFGLGDVYMGNGAWKYWVQYREGVYNEWTLGYYTDGGNFQFIYDITTMGDVPGGDGDKPDPKPSITEDGEIKTETSSEKKNEDGSITRIKTETTERLDGSREEVETRVDTSADGSKTTTTVTTLKTDPDGNQTRSESIVVVEKTKGADGNEGERRTTTEKDEDGNVTQSVSNITTSKDGTVTEKTKGTETKKDGSAVDFSITKETKKDGTIIIKTESVIKDANGKVTATKKSESTTGKIPGGTKVTTTETFRDKDGNIIGIKETEETRKGSETKVVETTKDANGNTVWFYEKTVKTQVKANGSVTTTTEVSRDANGKETGSSETVVDIRTTGNGSIKTTTKVKKDADGKAVSSTEIREEVRNTTVSGGRTQTSTTIDSKTKDSSGTTIGSSKETKKVVKNKDGTLESFDSTLVVKDRDGTTVEEVRKSTSETKDKNGSTVSRKGYARTTPEGSTSVDSESVTKDIDNGSQTDSKKTTVVKDKDGNETKVIESGRSTDTDKERKDSSSIETIRNGASETRESSTVESKEVSGLKSSVEVEKKGDKVTKAESVTIVPAKDGGLDADSVRMAIDQSSAAMNEVSVDSKDISKTIEVRNDSGASVIVSSEAIGRISEHGASLKVGSGKESIHVDGKVVNRLSGDKDVKLEMDRNVHSDLNDMQKQVVGDRQFIVLGAFVGDSRIHELGGVATVVFGYELRDGEDASRLYVWYVDDNGVKTKMKASYDQSTGRFTMETTHFSVFMVAPEDQPVPTPDDPEGSDDTSSNAMLYIGVAAIVLVFVAAIVLMHRRKV